MAPAGGANTVARSCFVCQALALYERGSETNFSGDGPENYDRCKLLFNSNCQFSEKYPMRFVTFAVIFAVALIAAGQLALAAGDAAKGKQVYTINCIACHNMDPGKAGAIGPAIKGSSQALIMARVLSATYPKGYKPKRATKMMPPMPHLKANIADLAAFLK